MRRNFAQQLRHPARPVEMLHIVVAARLQVHQHWHVQPKPVEFRHIQLNPQPAGHGGKMDQRVGRPTNGLQHRQRIAKSRRGHNIARPSPARRQPHRGRTRGLGGADAVGMRGRNARGPRQAHPHRLHHARHRARRAHHHAGALGRRQPARQHVDLRLIDLTGAELAPHPPAIRARPQHLAFMVPHQHRPGRQHHGGDIGARRPHQLRRQGLVAAADHQHRIHRLGADHLLGIQRHQITQEHRRRVGKALGDGNRRELHRHAAGQQNPPLGRLDQFRHVAVARVKVAERVGNADNRPVQRLVGKPHRLDERAAQKQRELGIAIGGKPSAQPGGFGGHGHLFRRPRQNGI